jgi:Ca-activated chloride channel family protein
MASMRDITNRTGGRAFLALDRAQLEGAYSVLDKVEPTKVETQSYRPARPLFWMPLAAAAALFLLFHAIMVVPTLWRQATSGHDREAA